MKNFDKNNLGRMKLVDFKVLRREAKERAHGTKKFMHRKHSAHAVLIDQEDVLQKKHMEFSHVKRSECTTECDYHEVCVRHKATGNTKCIHKKFLKASHRLSKFNMHHKRGKKQHHRLMKEFHGHSKKFNPLETSVNELNERPINVRHKQIMASQKKNKNDLISRHRLIENMDAVDELMHMGEGRKSEMERKYPECSRKVEDLRRRLNEWFVVLHEQKKEHRNKKYMKKHPLMKKPKHYGDFRAFGQCKCSSSVMWERRSLDKNEDRFLDRSELAIIEDIHQEQCITPLLESCDTDKDKLLSKKEWCCCFTDTEAPCFKHLERFKEGTDSQGYRPACTAEGFYEKTQCDKTGSFCWCSDLDGNQIANTKTSGAPHCERFDTTGRQIQV